MARPGGEETRALIRQAVRKLLRERGLDALTLDAVADEVGVTRQAVLYHFGSRHGLLAESYLELLAAESHTLADAAEAVPPGRAGIGGFLNAALAWHLEDLNRYRVIYAINQVTPVVETVDEATLQERVYPVTGRLYTALQHMLDDGSLPDGVDARRLGIALHMFTLGVASYEAMLDATGGSFAHDWHDIAQALAAALSGSGRDGQKIDKAQPGQPGQR